MAPKRATRGGSSPSAAAKRVYDALTEMNPRSAGTLLMADSQPAALAPAYQAIYDDLAILTESQKETVALGLDKNRRSVMSRVYNTGRMLAAAAGRSFPAPLPEVLSNPTLSTDERTAIEALMMLSQGASRTAAAAAASRSRQA